ncbi:MAG TPA: Rv1355c family protein, partial [Polyangiales bacterium]|nr:Rv1355c family protein [Polyangiales bacterium]
SGHAEQLQRLKQTAQVCDSLRTQVGELLETRRPDRKLKALELESEIDRVLEAESFGTWAYYPWSNRLVHVLPAAEFAEVRSSRNRNKITLEEQQRLGKVTLGVAGLSVGQATAVTLALEGLGGTLRLADFDTLSLSNMNRLRAGVHEIGVNKAVVTAREIWEFNPYARIELFEDGIVDNNLGRFLDGLDLLFEECDDLKMKVLLREEAKKRRIPVLMETSDRGLFDVERFDLEPERPLFHGLVGELRAEQLSGLSTYEKVPVVLSVIGGETMSPRLAGSMVDVDATLKTWPQLASAVALGGAINTDVARRILLGSFRGSGRYFVDLEDIIADGREVALHQGGEAGKTIAPTSTRPRRSSRRSLYGELSREQLDQIVHAATLAPSGGNVQPWRFVFDEAASVLQCWLVPERARTFLDFQRRASHLAFGALAENIRLAAAREGFEAVIEAFPDPGKPELICVAQLDPNRVSMAGARERLLADWIESRVTNRKLGARTKLSEAVAGELRAMFAGASCRLTLIEAPQLLDALGDAHGETERLRMLHPLMHDELMGEVRWSLAEAERTRDGIDVATLEMTPTDRAGITVLQRQDVIEAMRRIDGGHGLKSASKKALASACAFGVVAGRGTSPAHYFEAGSRVQRLWLLANARGLALQPMTAMLYVFARLDGRTAGLSPREVSAFQSAREAFRALVPPAEGETELFAFRLAEAEAPSGRSLRRPFDELLEFK